MKAILYATHKHPPKPLRRLALNSALQYCRAMVAILHDQDFSLQGYGKDLSGHICIWTAEGHTSRVALRKLTQIHGAATLEFLRVPPGNRLEKLVGEREGQWSVRINDQWRICFNWQDGHAYNVEIVDYH